MSFVVRGLTYGYTAGRDVLSGVNLKIAEGSTTAILGASGSGKSTLLYLLGLLWDGRINGQIEYHGGERPRPYDELYRRPAEAAALRLKDFGFVLQSSYMLPNFSCAQNAAMPLSLQGVSQADRSPSLRQLVERLDGDGHLAESMTKAAGSVSGGQRQRFAVARAVIHDPQVVFADEPFSSLDEEHTEKTLSLLASWKRGELLCSTRRPKPRTLILVCHDLEMALAHADSLVFIRSGRAIADRAFGRRLFDGVDSLRRVLRTGNVPTAALAGRSA